MNKTAQTSTLKHEAGDRNKLVLHCYSTVQVYTAFLAETKKTTEKTEAFYTLSKVKSEQICVSLKHFSLGNVCILREEGGKGKKKTAKKGRSWNNQSLLWGFKFLYFESDPWYVAVCRVEQRIVCVGHERMQCLHGTNAKSMHGKNKLLCSVSQETLILSGVFQIFTLFFSCKL